MFSFLLAGAGNGEVLASASRAGVGADVSPSVAGSPGAPAESSGRQAPVDTAAMDPQAPVRRSGLMVSLYGGLQFGIVASKVNSPRLGYVWGDQFTLAPRCGLLVGGHLAENYTLAGELAFATWNYLHDHGFANDDGEVTSTHRASQFDFDAVLLRTMDWKWAEVVAGPKLGWTALGRKNDPNVAGPNVGVKLGLLTPARRVSLGFIADISFLLVVGHDLVGSLAAAALF